MCESLYTKKPAAPVQKFTAKKEGRSIDIDTANLIYFFLGGRNLISPTTRHSSIAQKPGWWNQEVLDA